MRPKEAVKISETWGDYCPDLLDMECSCIIHDVNLTSLAMLLLTSTRSEGMDAKLYVRYAVL